MKITCYGMGYCGQAYSAWLASIGNDVYTIGALTDNEKIEPQLRDVIDQVKVSGRLRHVSDTVLPMACDLFWLTFDTPIDSAGLADVDFIIKRAVEFCDFIPQDTLLVISSQIPIGTLRIIENLTKHKCAYIPENVRVGKGWSYLCNPDRIVLGSRRIEDIQIIERVLEHASSEIEIIAMSPESAELVKHGINSFLATCISFSNEFASIVEKAGGRPEDVTAGLQSEFRIGRRLPLKPGAPFSSGHLERDLHYLETIAVQHKLPIPLLRGVTETNNRLKQ